MRAWVFGVRPTPNPLALQSAKAQGRLNRVLAVPSSWARLSAVARRRFMFGGRLFTAVFCVVATVPVRRWSPPLVTPRPTPAVPSTRDRATGRRGGSAELSVLKGSWGE